MQIKIPRNIQTKLSMYSGWILYLYVFTHLLNHTCGIFGLNALESARTIFIAFWRSPILNWSIVAAFLVHLIFVLIKLFKKRTYKGMTSGEWTQIVLGFFIPDLFVNHVFETKMTHQLFGVSDTYTYYLYWTQDYYSVLFLLMLAIVWTHGSIGVRSYIKQKQWYPRWSSWLAGLAVALPIFALWGAINAQNAVRRLSADPQWVAELVRVSNPRRIDLYQWTESWEYYFSGAYFFSILLFFLARKAYMRIKKKRSGILVKFLEGKSISVTKGTTLLEASLQANVPHAHVCGGRGRCSTCRVQIIEGLEDLPPPTEEEITLLSRVKGNSSVRLACRTRPSSDCTIYPLLLPNVTLKDSLWRKQAYTGTDRNVAILFTDLRGFTSISEDRLPYDVVFVLNQYFQYMGQAVEAHHGRIDKFIGDAIMAIFGIDRDPKQACRDALAAARSMRLQLDRLNAHLKNELTEPLRMGFGVHCGHVIIGEMGYKDSNNLVAIGDATNTASRLESLTKEFNCEMIVSRDAVEWAELDFDNYESHETEVRGRNKTIRIYCIDDVKELSW